MALTQEQVQQMRGMSGEAIQNFHLNRIANALEEISEKLEPLRDLGANRNPLNEIDGGKF